MKKANTKPKTFTTKNDASVMGLLPLLIFVILFVLSGIILDQLKANIVSEKNAKGFYLIYAPIIALAAAIIGFCLIKGSFNTKLNAFLKGSTDQNILIMIFIYLLSGVFAKLMNTIGASSAISYLGFKIIPTTILVGGVFIISATIATAMGTSVGTIVAFGPIVFAMAHESNIPTAMVAGALLSGAMFGDNLSTISDTAIATCKTQDVTTKERFLCNWKILLLPAIITIILFFTITYNNNVLVQTHPWIWWKALITVIPFLVVLMTALLGFNVFIVLLTGIILAFIVGFSLQQFGHWNGKEGLTTAFFPDATPFNFNKIPGKMTTDNGIDRFLVAMKATKSGMINMSEVILLALLTGGLSGLSELTGGMTWLTNKINRQIKNKRSAELGIISLASIADITLANNTNAIIVTGPIIKKIGAEQQLYKPKVAAILTIVTAVFQGLIPYGAQMLILLESANENNNNPISFIDVWKYSWYLYLLLLMTIAFIIFQSWNKFLAPRFGKNKNKTVKQ